MCKSTSLLLWRLYKPALEKVWLGKLTTLNMTLLGWLGHKTSTQTIWNNFKNALVNPTTQAGLKPRVLSQQAKNTNHFPNLSWWLSKINSIWPLQV